MNFDWSFQGMTFLISYEFKSNFARNLKHTFKYNEITCIGIKTS